MTFQTVTTEQLAEQGYPAQPMMVELVNADLLPFFAEHDRNKFPIVTAYEVTALLGENGKDFIFQRSDGKQLGAWKEYFLNPEQWKLNRLLKMQGITY